MGVFQFQFQFLDEFWFLKYVWASLISLLLLLIAHLVKTFFFPGSSSSSSLSSFKPSKRLFAASASSTPAAASVYNPSVPGISELVSEGDLKFLIENLDEKLTPDEKWENVIDKSNNLISYTAKCCKTKDAPLKYLSVTIFANCSLEVLRDFYMDNDYRKQWDKTLVEHVQLQVDTTSGIEIGRTIKKFPLLTPREYLLGWRLWEGKDKTFYCFIKECEHPSAPRQRKYVRVAYFRSGWRIRQVPGRNACEIKMFHQEDAGLNVEMAKLAFARGIWSYVRKMGDALYKYSASHPQTGPAITAVSLIQEVPSGLETMKNVVDAPGSPAATALDKVVSGQTKDKKLHKGSSRKVLANGLLLLGGIICLSCGHSSLGAKVAMAFILTKLRKHDASSSQSQER